MIKSNGTVIQQQVKSSVSFDTVQLRFIAEKTSKKALANVTIEDQINAIHRSQGLLDEDASAANRIGPSVPKPTTTPTYSSTAKTIQKPPQLSPLVTKPVVPMAAPPQRTLVTTPMMPRAGIQSMTLVPQTTHTMVAMPPMVAVAPQPPLHPPPLSDEPSAKRSKTEDQLIPEEEFYKTFGKVRIIISLVFFKRVFLTSIRVKLLLRFNCQLYLRNQNGILMDKLYH